VKQKSLSQMNSEKKLKPMTIREEYANAGVPVPNDMLNAANTEEFNNKKQEAEDDYSGGKAYYKFLELFYKNKKEEDDLS